MEGTAHSSLARAWVAALATVALGACLLVGCASAPPSTSTTPIPTLAPRLSGTSMVPASAAATSVASPATAVETLNDVPDSPLNTSALAAVRPLRGSSAPEGAVVFGNDVQNASGRVSIVNARTTFPQGHPIAWRVTLPAATGGETVRVTVTDESDAETVIDEFVAQPGWNVYFGKSLLTVDAGTYVLHYLVDGHEVGSGTFKIRPADQIPPVPTGMPSAEPSTAPTMSGNY